MAQAWLNENSLVMQLLRELVPKCDANRETSVCSNSSNVLIGPVLPSKREVLNCISDVSKEIHQLTVELRELCRERERLEEDPDEDVYHQPFQIAQYRGLIFSRNLMNDFKGVNRARIAQSHTKYMVESAPILDYVEDLPQYKKNIETQSDFLPVIFNSIFWRKSIVREQKMLYAEHYKRLMEIWKQQVNPAVDSINLKYHIDMRNVWGDEQQQEPTVPFEGPEATANVAPDVEQRLRIELPAYNNYVDNNMFVEDPVRAHEDFKRRIRWTDEEKERFLQLFWMHPHKFSKIAESFPNKTGKDMIEMYYCIKTSDDMSRAKAAMIQRRGAKAKKVITEGKVGRK